MPISPPRICQKHKTPFTGQRCPTCTEAWKKHNKENDNRESAHKRGYNKTWQKVRDNKLKDHPYCERCMITGKVRSADLVHHVDRNSRNNESENLISMCLTCHQAEHKSEAWGGGKFNCHK